MTGSANPEIIDGWLYSGSDTRVADGLREIVTGNHGADERLSILLPLVALEKDPNWLGVVHMWLGTSYLIKGERIHAERSFSKALDLFDPIHLTFADVEDEFASCVVRVFREFWNPKTQYHLILQYGFMTLAVVFDPDFDIEDRWLILTKMATALSQVALENEQLSSLFDSALGCEIAAYKSIPTNPTAMAGLAHALYNAGRFSDAVTLTQSYFAKAPADHSLRDKMKNLAESARQYCGSSGDHREDTDVQ